MYAERTSANSWKLKLAIPWPEWTICNEKEAQVINIGYFMEVKASSRGQLEQKSTLNYISKEKENRIYHFLFDFF